MSAARKEVRAPFYYLCAAYVAGYGLFVLLSVFVPRYLGQAELARAISFDVTVFLSQAIGFALLCKRRPAGFLLVLAGVAVMLVVDYDVGGILSAVALLLVGAGWLVRWRVASRGVASDT